MPQRITRRIEDPIAFYQEWDKHFGVVIDPEVHQAILRGVSGGRSVYPRGPIIYRGGKFTIGGGVALDENTDAAHLS